MLSCEDPFLPLWLGIWMLMILTSFAWFMWGGGAERAYEAHKTLWERRLLKRFQDPLIRNREAYIHRMKVFLVILVCFFLSLAIAYLIANCEFRYP